MQSPWHWFGRNTCPLAVPMRLPTRLKFLNCITGFKILHNWADKTWILRYEKKPSISNTVKNCFYTTTATPPKQVKVILGCGSGTFVFPAMLCTCAAWPPSSEHVVWNCNGNNFDLISWKEAQLKLPMLTWVDLEAEKMYSELRHDVSVEAVLDH